MTLAYYCVLMAALFPYFFTVLAKSGKPKYRNDIPREYLEGLQGWRKRAHWVQFNSFEAFPFFAAAVIIAHLKGAFQSHIDYLAIAFILTRILYGICYITDKPPLRSLFWFLGFGSVITLFFI